MTLGGTGRWDLRGGGAILSTEGNAYNITKVGTNQISFVAATIDPALGAVDFATNDLSVPLASWTVVASGHFDANGNLNATVPIASDAYRFYAVAVGAN